MVHAGVDDEPHRKHQVHQQTPVVIVGIIVNTELESESGAVLTPAFHEGGVERLPAKSRQGRILRLQRNLEVMTGNELMQHQRCGEDQIPLAQLRPVVVVVAHRIGRRRRLVVAERHAGLARRVEALDIVRRSRSGSEELRDGGLHFSDRLRQAAPDFLRRLRVKPGVVSQHLVELCMTAAKPEAPANFGHLPTNLLHLAQPDPMNLLGGEVECGA